MNYAWKRRIAIVRRVTYYLNSNRDNFAIISCRRFLCAGYILDHFENRTEENLRTKYTDGEELVTQRENGINFRGIVKPRPNGNARNASLNMTTVALTTIFKKLKSYHNSLNAR